MVNQAKIYLPVFSFTAETGEKFFDTLGLHPDQPGELNVGAYTVTTHLIRLHDQAHEDVRSVINRADACLMLVRHLDQATMHLVKETYQLVHNETFLPKSLVLLREPKEAEFKISCTYCGQKLWVRDRDAGRRGNCPKCRKTFFIPTQKAYLVSFLMLMENEPVETVITGEHSCRDAVEHLVARIAGLEEGAKSSTMRIELPPEEFSI